jgi:hypothetical protein
MYNLTWYSIYSLSLFIKHFVNPKNLSELINLNTVIKNVENEVHTCAKQITEEFKDILPNY